MEYDTQTGPKAAPQFKTGDRVEVVNAGKRPVYNRELIGKVGTVVNPYFGSVTASVVMDFDGQTYGVTVYNLKAVA